MCVCVCVCVYLMNLFYMFMYVLAENEPRSPMVACFGRRKNKVSSEKMTGISLELPRTP